MIFPWCCRPSGNRLNQQPCPINGETTGSSPDSARPDLKACGLHNTAFPLNRFCSNWNPFTRTGEPNIPPQSPLLVHRHLAFPMTHGTGSFPVLAAEEARRPYRFTRHGLGFPSGTPALGTHHMPAPVAVRAGDRNSTHAQSLLCYVGRIPYPAFA